MWFVDCSCHRRRNQGGTRGTCPLLVRICLLVPPPPSNCLVRWPFWPYPVAGTRAVMAQRSLNMASGTPKALGPSIPTASSPNINLSTNMASEAISQHLILNIFLGEMPPHPPSAVRAYAHTIIGAPPIVSTFCHLCMCIAVMTIVIQFYTYMTYMCRTVKDHVYSCKRSYTCV